VNNIAIFKNYVTFPGINEQTFCTVKFYLILRQIIEAFGKTSYLKDTIK